MEEETEKHHMKGKVTDMLNKIIWFFDSIDTYKTNEALLKILTHTKALVIFLTIGLFVATHLGPNLIDKYKYPDIYNSYEKFYDIYTRILIISGIILSVVLLTSAVLYMYSSYIIWKKDKNKE